MKNLVRHQNALSRDIRLCNWTGVLAGVKDNRRESDADSPEMDTTPISGISSPSQRKSSTRTDHEVTGTIGHTVYYSSLDTHAHRHTHTHRGDTVCDKAQISVLNTFMDLVRRGFVICRNAFCTLPTV